MKTNALSKQSIYLIAILFISILGRAQAPTSSPPDFNQLILERNADYYTIQSQVESYIASTTFTTDQVEDDDKFFSKYHRWQSYWKSKVAPGTFGNGDPQIYMKALKGYSQVGLGQLCTGTNNSDWSLTGPQNLPISRLGKVSAVMRHPTNQAIVYLGTSSAGVWKSTNATSTTPTWNNITDGLNLPTISVTDIRIDPSNSNTIWVTTGADRGGYSVGVLKSTNAGLTWSQVIQFSYIGNDIPSFYKVLIDPSNSSKVYVLGKNQFRYTNNGGTTWTNFNSPNTSSEFKDFEFCPTFTNTLVISDKDNVWRMHAASNVWTSLTMNQSIHTGTTPLIDVASSNIYVHYANGSSSYRIEKSTDGGGTWSFMNSPNYSGVQFEVNSVNDNIMYIGDDLGGSCCRKVNKSINGGANFYHVSSYFGNYNGTSTHGDIRDLELLSSSSNGLSDDLIVGTDGGIMISTSSTVSGSTPVLNWVDLNGKNLAISEFFGIDVLSHLGIIAGGTQDNSSFIYKDGWIPWGGTHDSYDAEIMDGMQNNDIYTQYNSSNHMGLDKTTNLGQSHSSGQQSPFCNGCGFSFPPSEWHKYEKTPLIQTNGTLYAGRFDVYKKVGSTWVAISDFNGDFGITTPKLLKVLAVAPSDPDVVIAAFGGKGGGPQSKIVFRTTNATSSNPTWTDITSGLNAFVGNWSAVEDIEFDPNDEDRVWVSFGSVRYDTPNDETDGKERVAYSSNTGTSFTDISAGLPVFPVGALVYQKGTSDCIYAATSVGVFYKTSSMPKWKCYQTNLPIADVRDLEINYCSKTLVAGTFGRGIWESPLAVTSNSGTKQYTTNTTITSDQFVEHQNVSVESGATLTLKNCTWYMMEGAKIVVKPGGKLVLDGAKLTNQCGFLWQGIEIWGNNTATQFPNQSGAYSQGRLITKNNSIVENANEAVRVWNPADWGSPGGIVQCTNTTFRNNKRSVEFIAYENHYPSWYPVSLANKVTDNKSYFSNCTFIHDAALNTGITPTHMVTMWAVRGIKFRGCTFKYEYDFWVNVSAIGTINADFEVGPLCTSIMYPCPSGSWDKSEFINISKAIVAAGALDDRSFQVHDSKFIDCKVGIAFDAVDDAFIVKNDFSFTKGIPGTIYCIHGEHSTRFKIEENDIDVSNNSSNFPVGILIENSGSDYNEIYKNEIDQAYRSVWGYGYCTQPYESHDGLKFICNEITSSAKYDIKSNGSHGASVIQGEYDASQFQFVSANNTFSSGHLITNQKYHYAQSGFLPLCMYYGKPDQGGTIYKPTANHNTYVSTNNLDRTCASNFKSGDKHIKHTLSSPPWVVGTISDVGDFKQIFNNHYSDYLDDKLAIDTIFDGGDDSTLLSQINNGMPGDEGILTTLLISNSPLSSNVFNTAVNSGLFDNVLLGNIVDVNSHLGRDPEVIDLLQTKADPFTQAEIDNLLIACKTITDIDKVLGSLAYNSSRWGYALNQIIDYYNSDTIPHDDSLLVWLSKVPRTGYYLSKALFHETNGNTSTAETILSTASQNCDLSDDDADQLADISSFIDDYNVQFARTNPWDFTSGFSAKCMTAAADLESKAGAYARNLLWFKNQDAYIIEDPEDNGPASIIQNPVASVTEEKELKDWKIEAHPNPANSYVSFMWSNLKVENQLRLSIITMEGRIVYTGYIGTSSDNFIFNTTSFGAGIYIYRIEDNNKIYKTDKLIINH